MRQLLTDTCFAARPQTIQSIALMGYLAEVHDIWGPFLVVAPASTLHNWQQEISRFVPQLKALPYWGNVKDRATLRKFWNRKQISYNKDAPFHVLVTSYQLVRRQRSGRRCQSLLTPLLLSPLAAGRHRREILPEGQVAVHDPRRGPGDQEFVVNALEDAARLPLPQPAPAHRHADPELNAGCVAPVKPL
jgi:hypothetical protein